MEVRNVLHSFWQHAMAGCGVAVLIVTACCAQLLCFIEFAADVTFGQFAQAFAKPSQVSAWELCGDHLCVG